MCLCFFCPFLVSSSMLSIWITVVRGLTPLPQERPGLFCCDALMKEGCASVYFGLMFIDAQRQLAGRISLLQFGCLNPYWLFLFLGASFFFTIYWKYFVWVTSLVSSPPSTDLLKPPHPLQSRLMVLPCGKFPNFPSAAFWRILTIRIRSICPAAPVWSRFHA